MKIKKIKDMIDIENQFDVELQGCLNDCKEYYSKTQSDYEYLASHGCKVDGTATVEEIRDIKDQYGFYCYRLLTAKNSSYL